MSEEPNVSDAEWVVMEALWALGGATPAEVIERLQDSGWNHRTIRTLLRRLVDKGHVKRSGRGGLSRYRPARQRATYVRRQGRSFLDRVFQGDAESLLVHFAREARLSPDKLKQLRRMLNEDEAAED